MTPGHECFAMNLFKDCLPALPHHRAFLATWFILCRENVLGGTERAFRGVLFRENVLTCTERVSSPVPSTSSLLRFPLTKSRAY